MRVLLVDPPFHRFMGFRRYYYPLGLAYIAGVLRESGHQVLIYDAEREPGLESKTWLDSMGNYDLYAAALNDDQHPVWAEFRGLLRRLKPQLVGISSLSVKSPCALKLAQISKQVDPTVPVVVGADHPSACPEDFLRVPWIDYVIRGEGEYALLQLVISIETGDPPLEHVSGLSYRDHSSFRHNDGMSVEDLDQLPWPARNCLLNPSLYSDIDYGIMMTSRGCPFKCTFCGVQTLWTRHVRRRSVANVIEEMKLVGATYGTRYFSFRDASFTLNRTWVLHFCRELIRQQLNIRWECLSRCDLLDDELIQLMKKAGCEMLRLGIESGSPEVLQYLQKNITIDQIRDSASMLRRNDLPWSAYLMFGVPIETRDTISQTMHLVREIEPDFITVARFTPIPGSAMYADLVDRGRIAPAFDWRWECNQNVATSFVEAMPQEEFREIMLEVAQIAHEHNQGHGWVEKRWA